VYSEAVRSATTAKAPARTIAAVPSARNGGKKTASVMTSDRTVATRPGRSPPYQQARTTAARKSGATAPWRAGRSARATTVAPATAAMATA